MSKAHYQSFAQELHKLGFSPRAASILAPSAAMGGAGMLLGGLGGAGVEGYRKYQDAKEQGHSTGHAALSGVFGGLGGIGRGALAGGALGAAVGGGIGFKAPETGERLRAALTRSTPLGAFSRFGQRQLHGITGWHPGENLHEGLQELRHGSYSSGKALEALKAQKGPIDPEVLARAQKRFDASRHAEDMGITSIPGYARSMISRDPNKGVINTVRAGVREQLHGSSGGEKAMMFGIPAASAAGTLLSHDDPENPDPRGSKGVRLAKDALNMGTNLVLGPLPQVTQMLAGTAIEQGAGAGAAAAQRLRRGRGRGTVMPPPVPGTKPAGILIPPEQEKTIGPPIEHEVSPGARGQAPEGAI